MNIDDEIAFIALLSESARARFLAAIAHAITVVIRVFILDSSQEGVERVRLANEINHQLLGYLVHLLGGCERKAEWLPLTIRRCLGVSDNVLRQQLEQAWAVVKRDVL